MLKIFLGFVAATFILFPHPYAQAKEGSTESEVICSLRGERNEGFRLIRLRDADKNFVGEHDVDNLRFSGVYNPKYGSLKIAVSGINEMWETTDSWFEAEMKLTPTEYARFRFLTLEGEAPKITELTCQVNSFR